MTKYLQILTCGLVLLMLCSCGAIKVEPVEEGESLRYYARVGYFLYPPQSLKTTYVKDIAIYAKPEQFVRCEPSVIVRLHSRFEQRFVEVQQGRNRFLFDTIAGRPLILEDDKYLLLDRYFKKSFPLPKGKARRKGQLTNKSNLLCEGKVWVGMNRNEFLITRPPPHNIIKSKLNKVRIEKWQYKTVNHFLKEYVFENGILQSHNDD